MDDETKASYEETSKHLRAELKRWETKWAQTHNGKKPGRLDIKENPDIARKYKDYNKLRNILSGKLPLPVNSEILPKKRRTDPVPAETPLKRTKYANTPSKLRPQDDGLMNTPTISRKLFSPAPVTSIGPTPQRDGRVLGLFDILVEKELATPSRRDNGARANGPSGRAAASIPSTPSKRAGAHDPESITKLGRTPMSSSRKQMLNIFATPMKNRRSSIDDRTPSSVAKLQFDTPAFLKRHSHPAAVDEDAISAYPAPLRLPKKPLVRGLSEIVASLRKVEDDALDDDLEALRELENEATDAPRPIFPSAGDKNASATVLPAVLEPDSQGRPMLLGGFDNEEMYDSPQEDGVDQNSNSVATFKKKGQKRTTRKVNIRPTLVRRPQAVIEENDIEEVSEEGDVIPETQVVAEPDRPYEDEASADEESPKANNENCRKPKHGPVKKIAKKVNELAHANFKRLKLRNHGAKGGPRFNSRFRRRR